MKGGKRLDKIFYTGSIDVVPVAEAENILEKLADLELALRQILEFGKEKTLVMCSNWRSGARKVSRKKEMFGLVIIMELPLESG